MINAGFGHNERWHLREVLPVQTVKSKRTRTYFDLKDVVRSDGSRREELIEREYPITPEYVTSFADGADYHKDPVGALNSAPVRKNLGDITALQEALGLDFETARQIHSHVRDELARIRASREKGSESNSEKKDGENNG